MPIRKSGDWIIKCKGQFASRRGIRIISFLVISTGTLALSNMISKTLEMHSIFSYHLTWSSHPSLWQDNDIMDLLPRGFRCLDLASQRSMNGSTGVGDHSDGRMGEPMKNFHAEQGCSSLDRRKTYCGVVWKLLQYVKWGLWSNQWSYSIPLLRLLNEIKLQMNTSWRT